MNDNMKNYTKNLTVTEQQNAPNSLTQQQQQLLRAACSRLYCCLLLGADYKYVDAECPPGL